MYTGPEISETCVTCCEYDFLLMSKLSERVPTDPGVKPNGRTAQVHVVVALGFDIISSSLCSRAHVQTAIARDGRGRRYLQYYRVPVSLLS